MTHNAYQAWLIAAALGAGALVLSGGAQAEITTLVVEIGSTNMAPSRPTAPINNLRDLTRSLARCWRSPTDAPGLRPVDVIFQVSFMRSGELFGKPQFINFSREVTAGERGRYYLAVAEMLERCSPLPFTDSMGGAVAGRMFRIDFVDVRNRRQAACCGNRFRGPPIS